MERGLVWPNTAWLLGRSSPSDYILSRLAGVFFFLMFYLFTLVKLGSLKVFFVSAQSQSVSRLPTWSLLRSSSQTGSPRTLTRVSHWGNQLCQTDDQHMNCMDHTQLTLQINNWLPTGTWLPIPTTGCTSWFWISSGALGSWRPTRFSPHIWQEGGKDIFQVFDASTFKTKVTMVTAQLVYTLITLVPVPFLFASYTVRLSTTFNTTMHTR